MKKDMEIENIDEYFEMNERVNMHIASGGKPNIVMRVIAAAMDRYERRVAEANRRKQNEGA